jgi:hypothetical protein
MPEPAIAVGERPPALAALRAVKVLHTVVWAFFAGCILAIPALVVLSRFRLALLVVAVVGVEVAVLVLNGMRCPLTDVAARYTGDRRANFDIYLPEWLARHNQRVFGTLYLASALFLLLAWAAAR